MQIDLMMGASGLYVGDMLFVLVSFILLVYLVGKFAWKPVVKMMTDRQQKVNDDLDNAAKSREEATTLAAKRQKELANSQNEASQIVSTARQTGEQQRDKIVNDAKTQAESEKQRALKDIAQQRSDALTSARNDVAQLSIDIATKIIGKELAESDQQDLIDSYIKGLGDPNGTK